jgi:hypothetical protein
MLVPLGVEYKGTAIIVALARHPDPINAVPVNANQARRA